MAGSDHILIVEDDHDIAEMVAAFLRENGFEATVASNGQGMDRCLTTRNPSLVILDLMLPGEGGLTIAQRLRAVSDVPIIMLTAMREETDRVVGLEIGADDYLGKPFSLRELLARIRAVLRRSADRGAGGSIAPVTYAFAGWRLKPSTRELIDPHEVKIALTSAEFDLLQVFCENPHRVLTRDRLLDLTRGRTANPFDRSVDTLVSRIRHKIETDPKNPVFVKTVRLNGYIFTREVVRS